MSWLAIPALAPEIGSAMQRHGLPSIADLAFIFIAPIFAIAGAVRLTQSDGDLAAHIRMGEYILEHHRIPAHSLGSYTSSLDPLVAPAWLSEVIFALLFRLGGLALVAVSTGLIVALTHSLIAAFLRNQGVDPRAALATALASLIVAAIHWLARPHMFSILAATVTLVLLESRRPWRPAAFFLLFGLWANLHGGWLYGLVVIVAYFAGNLIGAVRNDTEGSRVRAKDDAFSLAAAFGGTLVNPYFLGLHREVAAAVTSPSLAAFIDEYQPPRLHEPESLPFFIVVVASAVLMIACRRRPPVSWIAVIAISVVFGFRASRNIALFAVTGLPLVALHAARSWRAPERRFPYFQAIVRVDAAARAGIWALPAACLLLALGVNRGRVAGHTLIDDRFDSGVFPVEAVQRARAAQIDGRVFHPWLWGGYLLYAWPGTAIHVDPLEFSQLTIDSHSTIENTRPGWRAELARWNVATAILERGSPLADSLASDSGWSTWHTDSTAVILRRNARGPTGGPGQ